MITNLKRFKIGETLRVEDGNGTILKRNELVTVLDPDRYPTARRALVRKAGYINSRFFLCVRRERNGEVGFYFMPRFRRATNKDLRCAV